MKLQTNDTAELYGLSDRGTLEVGKKGDVNVIDFDNLSLDAPKMVHDLPATPRGFFRRRPATWRTVVSGEVTWRNGEPTGAVPAY